MLPVEQHFAEKIHVYSYPREKRPFSRIRDLVDLVLIIEQGLPDKKLVISAIIFQYLDCGILHNGFARIKCRVCNHERSLLKELSKISWEVIKDYYISTCRKDGGSPAAVAVIQTFGDYLSFNPHMHILAADGCFSGDGFFYAPSINIDTASLEKLFIHKIFKMLLSKGLITERVIELISSWRHTGFGVYCGKRINPKEERPTENLARYIIRASFS